MKSLEKLYEVIGLSTDVRAINLLREFIIDNTPTKGMGEFKMEEFCSDDALRPVMQKICMDNEEKVAVATNAHVLFVSKKLYVDTTQNIEGEKPKQTLVDKYNNVWGEEAKFPNWKAVIPTTNLVDIEIRKDLADIIKISTQIAKENKAKPDSSICIEVATGHFMSPRHAKFIVRAGLDGWQAASEKHEACLLKKWDGNTMLVMPMMPVDPKENGYIFDDRGFSVKVM